MKKEQIKKELISIISKIKNHSKKHHRTLLENNENLENGFIESNALLNDIYKQLNDYLQSIETEQLPNDYVKTTSSFDNLETEHESEETKRTVCNCQVVEMTDIRKDKNGKYYHILCGKPITN